MDSNIVVDAREFVPGRITGIGRVLIGLVDALTGEAVAEQLILVLPADGELPKLLEGRNIKTEVMPASFLKMEKQLTTLTRDADLFISPYPKLPLWGCHCPCIHTVHDVLNLTHPLYRHTLRNLFERWRLKRALRQADLTWYDSQCSRDETLKVAGFESKHSEIRSLGVDLLFDATPSQNDGNILAGMDLEPGYIIVTGNGLPHKNLGVVLACADKLKREIVFVGVSKQNREYWNDSQIETSVRWLDFVPDEALPALLRQAYCLAQPSTAEGYGYPPLEAMSCGTPAVVSDIPVLVETTGGAALTVDPHVPDEWLHAFERLEDENIYNEQCERGLQWTSSLKGRIGWEAQIKDIQSLLGTK